jgi:hypothetical protein
VNISVEKLIVRQVSNLVAATVEVLHEDDPRQQIALEAHLYRTLAFQLSGQGEACGRVRGT